MFGAQLKCDSFRTFGDHFSVLDQKEIIRERMNSLNTQWEKIRDYHKFWRRKTEAILCIPFAVKHGDEELSPTLSRLEVVAILY
jgi:hypothetical protein